MVFFAQDSGSPPRQFRLRLIFVAITGTIGSAFLFFGLYSLFATATHDWIDVFDNWWLIFLGSCLIASSILWWNGRWLIGIALIATCLSLLVAVVLGVIVYAVK